jgi:hypothetical protein
LGIVLAIIISVWSALTLRLLVSHDVVYIEHAGFDPQVADILLKVGPVAFRQAFERTFGGAVEAATDFPGRRRGLLAVFTLPLARFTKGLSQQELFSPDRGPPLLAVVLTSLALCLIAF